jgi:hypothetical protein
VKRFYLSASATKTFLSCARKWYFEKVEKRRPESTPSQARGSEIHRQLEMKLKKGEPLVDPVAVQIYQALPRFPVLDIERKFERGDWLGYIDLVYATGDNSVGVSDHKTTSNLRYALTDVTLYDDIQATAYAYLVQQHYPADLVHLHWTYGRTRGKAKSQTARTQMTRAFAEDRIATLNEKVLIPAKALLREKPGAQEVEPDTSACSNYGGCPHASYCEITDQQRIASMSTKKSLWEKSGMVNRQPVKQETPAVITPAPIIKPGKPALFGSSVTLQKPTKPALFGKQPTAPVQAPAPAQVPAPVKAPPVQAPAPEPVKGRGFTLLVNCWAQDAQDLSALFAQANEIACRFAISADEAPKTATDYMLIPYKGSGYFATALRYLLDGGSDEIRPVIKVSSSSWLYLPPCREAAVVVSILSERAGRVVTGVSR